MPPLCDLCGLCGGKRLGRCFSTRKGHLNSYESSYIGMLEGNKKSPPSSFSTPSPASVVENGSDVVSQGERGI
jgi:hypothetical protein